MVRTLICEESVEKYIQSLLEGDLWDIGLVVGQVTEKKDFIVSLVKSPQPDNDPPECVAQVDDHWIGEHAKQVCHMLPGGLQVLGIYLYSTTDSLHKTQALQKSILSLLYRNSQSPFKRLHEHSVVEYCCLHISSDSKKTTCKTLDLSNTNSNWRPADLTYQPFLSNWVTMQCSIVVDHQFSVSKSHCTEYSFYKQILLGLSPLCEDILDSLALVNGQLKDSDDPFTDDNTRGKKSNRTPKQKTIVTIDLLSTTLGSSVKSEHVTVTECNEKVSLRGVIEGRACVNGKATVAEATSAIKHDIVHSLLNRCRLLCEDLLQSAEEIQESIPDPHLVYVCPRRVFTTAAYPHLVLCDYMFVDEQISDCVGRFSDLFNIQLTEAMIDADSEHFPTETDLTKPSRRYSSSSSSSLTSIAQQITLSVQDSSHISQITLLASLLLVVSVMVCVVVYLLFQPDEGEL